MSTKTKIQQLEKVYKHITKNRNKVFIARYVTQDGRYVDRDGYLLSEAEINLIKKEDEENKDNDGVVINIMTYGEPKIRPT